MVRLSTCSRVICGKGTPSALRPPSPFDAAVGDFVLAAQRLAVVPLFRTVASVYIVNATGLQLDLP